jgi:hypothetical protein
VHGRGRGIRADETRDLVAGIDEVGNDGRADPTGRAGDKNTHENLQGGDVAVGAGEWASGQVDVSY